MSALASTPLVLVVEDERGILEPLLLALRCEAFRVQSAGLGADALALVRSEPPDLIVLDVGLPDTTGFEVCKALRRFSEVPVIFLTARGDEFDRVLGLELGADDYLTKPFSPREFIARIRSVLKRTRVAEAPGVTMPTHPNHTERVVDQSHACVRYEATACMAARWRGRVCGTPIHARCSQTGCLPNT